jgi:hypothetical protein
MCWCGGRFFYKSRVTLPERFGLAVGWLTPPTTTLVVMDVDELGQPESEERFMERKYAQFKNRKQANA